MARISVSDTRSSSGRSELGRAVTALAVIAAHVALFFVMSRSTGHLAEVVDTIFVTLPITPEDRPQEPALVQKPPSAPAAEHVPRHAFAAREVATVPPRVEDSSRTEAAITDEKVATPASPALEPAPPVDWHAARYGNSLTNAPIQEKTEIERRAQRVKKPGEFATASALSCCAQVKGETGQARLLTQ